MKKIFIIAAAVATLAACQKNSPVEIINNPADDNAIGFSAYTASAVTKGSVVALTDIIDPAKGIGVFAFYQPAATGDFNTKKYATPDFMYNQQVKPDANPATEWTYSPLKYWPNNTGDKLSFFAYAPYDEDKTWEDLGFSTDINAKKLTATFPVYNEMESMVDYLFAEPALNKSKQKVATAPATDLITFDFKHIMSKVAIQIGAIVDKVPATTPKAWTDATTKITIEKLEFKGIAESYDYTYTIALPVSSVWVASGSQNLLLTSADFESTSSLINTTNYAADDWKPLLKEATNPAKGHFLFIAPQDLTNAELVITYTVETKDEDNLANSSKITNVITKKIGVNFATGKAYNLNLLIGMKTVELSASVTDWLTGATDKIDVPANEAPAE